MTTRSLEDIVDGHIARNRELCSVIETKGVDLAVVRAIDLHFWADDELSAHELVNALRDRGYSEITVNPTDGALWSVEAAIEASVLSISDPNFTRELAELAMSNNCEYDGWGTEI